MKKISFLFFSLLLLAVTSCKKDTVDVTELLTTVPSSSAGVIVFNVEDMLKDTGSKIKDHKIQPSSALQSVLQTTGVNRYTDFGVLFDENTGVEPKGAIVFYDAGRAFLTFALYDVNLFTGYIENKKGITFAEEGTGVKVAGNVALKGAQAWICLTNGKRIDCDAIAGYSKLAPSQSFLVTPIGERLLTDENDIRGWALLDIFMQQVLDRGQRSIFSIGISFLFEDAESVNFKVDFNKGEMEAEAIVLNTKGKPAKYQLPSDKVNVETLATLGETCDAMMAFTVSPKLIKKFDKVAQAFGGALFGNLGDLFKNVDGTIGVIKSGNGIDGNVNGFITMKGEVSQTLKDMVSENVGGINEEGKLLRFSRGDVSGSLSVKECAEELKGCCLGLVFTPSTVNNEGYGTLMSQGFKCGVLKFKPESGGLEMEFEAKCVDKDRNSLEVILEGL